LLKFMENVLGAMDVGFSLPHEFSSQEQQLLLLIGNQIGAAIENAQLYAEVEAQVTRITSLYELGKHLSGALDTQTLLQSVHSEISRVFPIDRFSYLTFNPEKYSTTAVFEAGGDIITRSEEPRKNVEVTVSEQSDISDAIAAGTSIRRTGLEGGAAMNSRLVVPVKSNEEPIGFLMVEAEGTDIYSEAHLRLLESIANLTEIALERARLYEDTINKSMEIEARNKELDDFTYVVSHDLKEPLISIEGYSKILLKDYKDKIDDEAREYLSSVVQSSARMKSLIDDLLTLSRLGRVTEAVHTVSVGLLIKEILHDLRFLLQEKHVNVTVPPGLPEVRYNATQLSMVFRNLISNALKFNNKPSPTIAIDMTEEDTHYVFSVADDGIGIDAQYYEKIFMIFQRLQRNEEYRGTGAGLTIVKKIVEKHHGRIWLDSTVGKGSTFYFTVPK
ncbi:MAG: ATP-binding protein, partial [Bacteroidota bacterium]